MLENEAMSVDTEDTEVDSLDETTVEEVETEADDTEVEEEATEAENEEQNSGDSADNAEKPKQSDEDNARFANIRRQAEEKARLAYEAKMNAMNERFKNAFGKYGVNNVEEYLNKYEEQQQKNVTEQLEKAGINQEQVMNVLQNTPEIRQLRQQAAEIAAINQQKQDEAELNEIKKLDPSISDWTDIVNKDTEKKFYELVFDKKMNKLDAFKLAFYEDIINNRVAASKQAAVNAARGKGHLKATTGGSGISSADMTDAELDMWGQFGFSSKEAKRFKARYAKE